MNYFLDTVYDASNLDTTFGQVDSLTSALLVFTIIFFILSVIFSLMALFSPKFKNKLMGENSKKKKKELKKEEIIKDNKIIKESIYCKYCGEEIDSNLINCKNCGRKIK